MRHLKRTFILFGSILISVCTYAQLSIGPSVYYGRSNFPNELNDIDHREGETYETEFGNSYVAGVFAEYQMKEWFSVQLDVLYDQLNFRQEDVITNSNPVDGSQWISTNERKAEYLSIPLTLQFNYKKMHANVGYQTSFLLSNYERRCTSDPYHGESCQEGKSITLTDKNISLLLSLSYQVYKGLEIEARYLKGMTNVSDGQSGWNMFYSSTVQYIFGLNYHFDLSKKKTEDEAGEEIEP